MGRLHAKSGLNGENIQYVIHLSLDIQLMNFVGLDHCQWCGEDKRDDRDASDKNHSCKRSRSILSQNGIETNHEEDPVSVIYILLFRLISDSFCTKMAAADMVQKLAQEHRKPQGHQNKSNRDRHYHGRIGKSFCLQLEGLRKL